ncbi:MAG: NADH-quinone oxidoreductase subunit N [Myxococcota bacterium]
MSWWIGVAPLLLLLGGGLLIMLADAFAKERAELATTATVTLTLSGAISFYVLLMDPVVAPAPELVTRYLAVDKLGAFFDVVICLGAALSTLLAGGYLREHGLERGEFYVLTLFSAFGAMVLARAADMMTLFIGLETMSLGVYAMIAFRRRSARAAEGAIKYFLLGSFAAAILLFGSALVYAGTGATGFAGIAEAMASGEALTKLVLIGLLLVIVGLAFKVSAVPFHMWTPDAYEGAPTPATTFMSVAVKSAAFAVFVRLLMTSFGDPLSTSAAAGWPPVLAGLAAVTMVFGNLAALGQSNVKRMLAYSSIAHTGYVLVGLGAAARVPELGVSSVLFYLAAYTVSNALAFGALVYAGSKGKEAVSYDDLAGLGRRHPGVGLAMAVGVLSLMGFPPTAGFFGKYYVFNAAVQAGGGWVWLAVLGVLSSAVGAYYYLRVVVLMFMREPAEGAPIAVPMKSGYVLVALVASAIFVMNLGLLPSTVLEMALAAAQELVGA